MLLKILFLFAIAFKQNQMTDAPLQRALKEECIINFTSSGISFNRKNRNLENMYNVSKLRLEYKIRYAVFCGDTTVENFNESENPKNLKDKPNHVILNGNGFTCNFENVSHNNDLAQDLLIGGFKDNSKEEKESPKIYPLEINTLRSNKLKVKKELCETNNSDNIPYRYYLWPVNRDKKGNDLFNQIVFLFKNKAYFDVNNTNKNTGLYIRLDTDNKETANNQTLTVVQNTNNEEKTDQTSAYNTKKVTVRRILTP